MKTLMKTSNRRRDASCVNRDASRITLGDMEAATFSDSGTLDDRIIEDMAVGQIVVTRSAASVFGVSNMTAGRAINRLVSAGRLAKGTARVGGRTVPAYKRIK